MASEDSENPLAATVLAGVAVTAAVAAVAGTVAVETYQWCKEKIFGLFGKEKSNV